MDKQKREWMRKVGIQKLPKPVVINGKEFQYFTVYPDGTEMYFSQEYLERTPLEQLKKAASRYGVAADG